MADIPALVERLQSTETYPAACDELYALCMDKTTMQPHTEAQDVAVSSGAVI